MYYVYVLKSFESGKYYKGYTGNLERRLNEHFGGRCQTTKTMGSLRLVFVQMCEKREEAIELEKYLKSGYGREIIHELFNN